MASKKMFLVVFVVIFPSLCLGQTFDFLLSGYEMEETHTPNANMNVQITRSGDTTMPFSLEIDTVCPPECPMPSASSIAEENVDYSVVKTISFPAFTPSATVSITILTDDIEEHKEYFCLRIKDLANRGNTFFTRVVIPWNDQCVSQFSIFDEGTTADALGYFIKDDIASVVSHVGPYDLSAAPEITIKVKPQPSEVDINELPGDANNLNIFVSNDADINAFKAKMTDNSAEFKWYGIHLDDFHADDHYTSSPTASASLDSWIDNSMLMRGPPPAPLTRGSLLGTALTSANPMVAHGTNEYKLNVDPSGSSVSLAKTGGSTLMATGGTITGLNNLFVTSARDKYASWEICGLEPRRLPTVGATASGHYQNFEPDLAIDNLIWYTSCFRSEDDATTGANWFRADLGAEFLVKKIVIYPVHYGEDLPLEIMDPAWLDNLKVYVGSCRDYTDLQSNTECVDIGDVTSATAMDTVNNLFETVDQELIIERNCVDDSIGRYVYLVPPTASTHIGFCEFRIYGTDVPLAKETKVFITANNVDVTVAEGSSATVKVTQSGTNPTCTYVQYHTDRDTGNDFTEAFPSKELKIMGNGDHNIAIPTMQDVECEGNESFNLYLTGIDGGVLGFASSVNSQCQAKVTITDNDVITYSLASQATSVTENQGSMTFTVSHNAAATQVGSAAVVFTGQTAALIQDFTTPSNLVAHDVSFPTSPQTVSVQIVDDNCYEESETFQVELSHLKPACSTGPTTATTITVTDNDSKFEFSSTGLTGNILTITEGETKTVTVTRQGTTHAKTIKFVDTLGSATAADVTITPANKDLVYNPSINSASITIVAADDNVAESTEVVQLTINDPNGVGCPNNIGANNNVIVKIIDNDFKYQFERPTSTNVAEGTQVTLCVNRVCPDPTNLPATTVAISGQPVTATVDDYSVPSVISIPQGQNRGCATILIRSDSAQEPSETFNVIINSGQSGVDGSDSVTLTIFDDDGTVGFGPASYTVTEGTAMVTLTVVDTSSQPIDIRVYTQDGTALAGSDYTALDMTYQIPANQNSLTIEIPILNDNTEEPNEQFTVRIESTNGQIIDGVATITIEDNDGTNMPNPPSPPDDGPALSGGAIAGIASAAVIGVIAVGVVLAVFGFLTGIGPFAAFGATTAVAAAVPFATTGAIGATSAFAAPSAFAAQSAFAAPSAFATQPAFAAPTQFVGGASQFGGVSQFAGASQFAGPQQVVSLNGGNAIGVSNGTPRFF